MTEAYIADLLRELTRLRLRESAIINEIETANRSSDRGREDQAETDRTGTNKTGAARKIKARGIAGAIPTVPAPIPRRESIASVDFSNITPPEQIDVQQQYYIDGEYWDCDYKKGDRVYIKNEIRKPSNWKTYNNWTAAKERYATVTEVTDARVFFTTDNGVDTWRQRKNLKRIQPVQNVFA
jgi:hypothetical protein